MGRQLNQLPAAGKDNGRATPPITAAFPPKYTPDSWEEVFLFLFRESYLV